MIVLAALHWSEQVPMMEVIQVEQIQHSSAVRLTCEEKAEIPPKAGLFSSRNRRHEQPVKMESPNMNKKLRYKVGKVVISAARESQYRQRISRLPEIRMFVSYRVQSLHMMGRDV
ncbi:hypothetical protein SCLCIDRAFT_1212792 [Scleroderma citrinum Foug A]|uniref:Uncharacterized protein n=1 Tax=Scleroderma citrinum Foug A TaxID=1036808 RepID=A0A0C2ZT93_9AGAM|nr:hypothetical protein SCLCIDRAFT_1212792 [Scleroderma citrinum Foug A]